MLQSGEAALPALVGSPTSWSVVGLLLLLIFKGVAYGLSLGSFRGGPTFPALFLGAVIGVLVGPLPGLGTTAGIAIGMTASTTAVLRLPVTSIVLVVLLLGPEGTSQLPIILLAAAIAMVTAVALDGRGHPATPNPGGSRAGRISRPQESRQCVHRGTKGPWSLAGVSWLLDRERVPLTMDRTENLR